MIIMSRLVRMRVFLKTIFFGVFNIGYLIIWALFAIAWYDGYQNGVVAYLQDAFGFVGFLLISLFSVLTFLLPLFLNVLKKVNLKGMAIKAIICIIYVLVMYLLIKISFLHFNTFSPEKWSNYPRERSSMINDLKDNYHIIGQNKVDIVDLLGEPDYQNSEYGSYIYSFKYGIIEFIFLNEQLTRVGVTNVSGGHLR